jgi:hypothetical protein
LLLKVFMKDPLTNTWHKSGQTEVIDDNLNPSFTTRVKVPYLFEVVQELQFRVWDYGLLCRYVCTPLRSNAFVV